MILNRYVNIIVVFLLVNLNIIDLCNAKFMSRCEFVNELIRLWPQIGRDELNSWTCIAENQSKFDRYLKTVDTQGTQYFGIFQIGDRFWCSLTPFIPRACGVYCSALQDNNLVDDFQCARQIYAEHYRIYGDGFSAWPVHALYCRQGIDYTKDCITRGEYQSPYGNNIFLNRLGNGFKENRETRSFYGPPKINKIYERCELARELYYVHDVPIEQVSTWVCIARYESNYNTSAVGHASGPDSADHGIFQISDLYWCSPPGKGQGCGLTCAKLENANITDDIQCAKRIYDEHQRLSGNGFNAWAVYQPYCKGRDQHFVSDCFDQLQSGYFPQIPQPGIYSPYPAAGTKILSKDQSGKAYSRCDLAKELRYKFNMPMETVHTWLCIAQQQSSMSTSKVSGFDNEGFRSFGIFQINEKYWCSSQVPGKGCNVRCEDLIDNDISNDIECTKTIFNEHQRIHGNGFQAWKSYEPYCKNAQLANDCFKDEPAQRIQPAMITQNNALNVQTNSINTSTKGKVYERCELARELRYRHNIPQSEVSTWVCIALYQSSFLTSATGVSEHGIFQINDKYWCSLFGKGAGCGISCSDLENEDITDDVQCARKIHGEQQRLYGDGFTAWSTYEPYCKKRSEQYVKDCFPGEVTHTQSPPIQPQITQNAVISFVHPVSQKTGKIYDRCELAKELRYKHNMPRDQLHMWVCIAHHESSFNTAAVGRLNADGSGDHGLFQISDLYWCSLTGTDKACGAPCSHFEDADITDDVKCIKKIHAEHQLIQGDGFRAWAVYEPYCKDRAYEFTQGCFEDETDNFNQIDATKQPTAITSTNNVYNPPVTDTGKTFERCELAKELRFVHNIPLNQIGDWVCIALYQSNLVSSAKGIREYGLFQISEEYWCSQDGGNGKSCGLSCSKLLDSDIADDIACAKRIYEEHQRISGNGFRAWTVYEPYCQGRSQQYIRECFTDSVNYAQPSLIQTAKPISMPPSTVITKVTSIQTTKATTETAKVTTPLPILPPKSTAPSKNVIKSSGKIFTRCELAKELRYVHGFPADQVHIWHCIAQQSKLNTSYIASPHAVGNRGYGIFQISEQFWCSSPDNTASSSNSCGIECSKLIDNDISDDAKCVQKIFNEHQRLYGKGFQAWNIYESYCKYQSADDISDCFENFDNHSSKQKSTTKPPIPIVQTKSKTYDRCELAKELRYKHNVPQKDVHTWVCIAQYASNFVTSTIRHVNPDGSSDYGLFQINNIHWCSMTGNELRPCGLPCSKLIDDDITDDIKCVNKIHAEHQRLFGNGFSAWKAYEPYCKNKTTAMVDDCFKGCDEKNSTTFMTKTHFPTRTTTKSSKKLNTFNIFQFNQPTIASKTPKATYGKIDDFLKDFHSTQVAKFSIRGTELQPIYFNHTFSTTKSPYAWNLQRATTKSPSFTTRQNILTTKSYSITTRTTTTRSSNRKFNKQNYSWIRQS